MSRAPVIFPSSLPGSRAANAVTLEGAVHLGDGAAQLGQSQLEMVLAHEGVHLAQQRGGAKAATRALLEWEAQQLAPALLLGQPVAPRYHAPPMVALNDPPQRPQSSTQPAPSAAELRELAVANEVLLRSARRRLEILRRYQSIVQRRLSTERELLDTGELTPRPLLEPGQVARINRRALNFVVSDDEVLIFVRFQARFEDRQVPAAARFPILRANLEAGIRATWNQQLVGMPLAGRHFEVIPEVTLISADAPRDLNYWLITVRPTDLGPMVYNGQSLGTAPAGEPTSATDSDLDGGVMSIPPLHVERPQFLGHESLHLFGFADRYLITQQAGQMTLHPTRPGAEGNRDPLGRRPGTILRPDLDFLFEHLGIYDREVTRNLTAELYIAQQAYHMQHVPTEPERYRAEVARLELDILVGTRLQQTLPAPLQAPPNIRSTIRRDTGTPR